MIQIVKKVELKHRLALRLARYTVVLAFIIGLLLSTWQVIGDYQNQEHSIDQTIAQILVVSGPPATRAVNTLDTTLAEEVVNGLLQYPFIISAQIKDELGKSLANSSSTGSSTACSDRSRPSCIGNCQRSPRLGSALVLV